MYNIVYERRKLILKKSIPLQSLYQPKSTNSKPMLHNKELLSARGQTKSRSKFQMRLTLVSANAVTMLLLKYMTG